MPKQKRAKRTEPDGVYFLKLLLYVLVGSQWVFFVNQAATYQIPVPVGLLIGFFFATRERFKTDRKIEFAVLLVACLIGFWTHSGILVTIP